MKKIIIFLLTIVSLFIFASCDLNDLLGPGNDPGQGGPNINNPTDDEKEQDTKDNEKDLSGGSTVDEEEVIDESKNDEYDNTNFVVKKSSGTDCYSYENGVITFGNVTENTVYTISGEFTGSIVCDPGNNYEFELELKGATITSSTECPISFISGKNVALSAKKDTENYIYDNREEVTAEEDISSMIYSLCDLDVKGRGTLYLESKNNNGIHSKDDLTLKNLTLKVICNDNALKGNDSVTIESGNYVLVSKQGDGIKTSNSSISDKGKQKGIVSLNGGTINVYAARDGIDSCYDVVMEQLDEDVNLVVNIYTDKYSTFSEDVSDVDKTSTTMYLQASSQSYYYGVEFTLSDGTKKVAMATLKERTYNGYIYTLSRPSNVSSMIVMAGTSSSLTTTNATYKSNSTSYNTSFDLVKVSIRSGNMSISFSVYQTSGGEYRPGGFGPGGGGGPQDEGNTDKADYSSKGLKADNQITINSGVLYVKSYDDALHANNDNTLENEQSPLGNITINGGTLTLYSNDDGLHADNKVTITGGNISLSNCYEGVEGQAIQVDGGYLYINSTDDGMNGVATSGTTMTFNGGYVYVYAKGDGIDSNSKTSKKGIVFNGGHIVIICNSNNNSSIDTEAGYEYNGGYVVAIGGGMSNQESANCSNFSTIGKKTSMSCNNYFTVNFNNAAKCVFKMPVSLSSSVVVGLGNSSNITFTTSTTTDVTIPEYGVYWN